MQVFIYGGIVLAILLMFSKSKAAGSEEGEANELPPSPPPPRPPSPGTTVYTPGPPSPQPTRPASPVRPPGSPGGQGVGISPAEIGRIQKLIADAFQEGLTKRKARLAAAKRSESQQRTINATAAHFRAQGVYLGKPSLSNPPAYYRQGEAAVKQHLGRALLSFMPRPLAPISTPGTKPADRREPTVTTTPAPEKIKLVREAYANAMAYAIDAAKQRTGKTLSPNNVLVPISQYFALFGIPHPNQLTAASKFWANPVTTIRKKTQDAVKYARTQTDIQIPPAGGQA